MSNRAKVAATLLILTLLLSARIPDGVQEAKAGSIIDTASGWNGTSLIVGGSIRTFGETFLVETPNTALNSFTLYLDQHAPMSNQLIFRVMAWNEFAATGPVLFEVSSQINGPIGPIPFKFNVGGLRLIADKTYVAFVDIGPTRVEGTFVGGGITSGVNSYPAGDLVSATFGQNLTSDTWSISPSGTDRNTSRENDIAFVALFTTPELEPVPEPTTLLLVGTTAAGIGLARWRQRRRLRESGGQD